MVGGQQRQRSAGRSKLRRLAAVGLLGLTLGVTLGPATASAAPPKTQECLDTYSDSQRLRKAGQLRDARRALLVCSQDQCPAVVRTDCVPWLTEVEEALPSIVVVAKDASGHDTVAVRVLIGDEVVAESLDGRPLILDPGSHQVRFEHGSETPIERTIVMQEGVKSRRVDVSFAPDLPAATAAPKAIPPDQPGERGEPVAGYVLTGVGVLALGSFAVFGLMGKAEADEYDETCAPTKTCDEDAVDGTRTKLLVADVSLLVGIAAVSVGVGLILHNKLSDPEPASAAVRLELGPVPGGAAGLVTWRF